MANDYAKALGVRLRTVRTHQGLSLQGVEAKSEGRWKAVVVGSYERGDRAVTVQRLADLADFYGVSLVDLLPDGAPAPPVEASPTRLVIDLDRLRAAPIDLVGPLARFVTAIRTMRAGDETRILALRVDDLRTLALIYDESPSRMAEQLTAWGVLHGEAT